jgi:5-formyltetrahydrofolate cyclo-ligase
VLLPSELRALIRDRRRGLSRRTRVACATRLARIIIGRSQLRSRARVAGFIPHDGEIDVIPVLERLRSMGKSVYLPALHGSRLCFLPWEPGTRLVLNRFGIPEPDINIDRRCPPYALDLVLMPLVAFDAAGNRLGMGAGYYDRTFAFLRRCNAGRRPLLLGVGFALQEVEALPTRAWDVPLHGVATETGARFFHSPATAPPAPHREKAG